MTDVPPPAGPDDPSAGGSPSPAPGPTPFGQPAPTPFGQNAPPPFGQAAPPFGQAAPPPGWGSTAPVGAVPPGGWTPGAVQQRSGMALAAFILGLAGLLLCFIFVPSLLAVIFGFVGLSAIRRDPERVTGRALAIWGIVLGFVGLAAFAVFLVLGLTGALDEESSSSLFLSDGEVVFSDLEIGQCIMLPDDLGGTIRGIEVADCGEPHDGEVFATGDLDPDDSRSFPGLEVAASEVEQACFDAFEPFVGAPYGDSELDVVYFYPREMSWRFDSGYVCVAVDPRGASLTGSVEGSGR